MSKNNTVMKVSGTAKHKDVFKARKRSDILRKWNGEGKECFFFRVDDKIHWVFGTERKSVLRIIWSTIGKPEYSPDMREKHSFIVRILDAQISV